MLPAARKEPVPVNARRLVLGARARRLGVAPVVHGLAEVPEGAGGNNGCDLGDEGVVHPLAGVEGLADVHPAGPEEPVAAAEPVGPDGEVVAEPVDVDGLAAVCPPAGRSS